MDDTIQNLISGNAEKSIEQLVNDTTTNTKSWTYIFIGFYDKFIKNNKLLFIWLLLISIYLLYKYNSAQKENNTHHHKSHKKHKKHKKEKKVPINDIESLENVTLNLDNQDEITNLKDEVESNPLRQTAEIKKNPNFNNACNTILGIDEEIID
jgi:flagellar biosynthesis component FlhA